ncbi:MAG: pseudouridine synthase [Candidatus Peribacteria bacterium]|jgi:23S rRNA pseudouridine2605 synthase|nr:pseudouridine synthase [Candidatus Peribacteria bacterium]
MNILNYLQSTSHLSRRKIVTLIKQGEILVNGKKVESFKHPIQLGDSIQIANHNSNIVVPSTQDKKLLLFNKPKGYVVSKSDPHNATIYELLPSEYQNYYYIGRLDKESRGLLLLTNVSELVHQYEHPKFDIEKEYIIHLTSSIKKEDKIQAKNGIIDDGELLKCKDIIALAEKNKYKIILNEGKKRQIRRIIKALGYELLDLQRIREGEYKLGNLKE